MGTISIDSKFFCDVRRLVLAKLLEVPRAYATGMLLELWHYCYEHRKIYVKTGLIDVICEKEGFEKALVKSGLGEIQGDYIRVRGVEDRLDD